MKLSCTVSQLEYVIAVRKLRLSMNPNQSIVNGLSHIEKIGPFDCNEFTTIDKLIRQNFGKHGVPYHYTPQEMGNAAYAWCFDIARKQDEMKKKEKAKKASRVRQTDAEPVSEQPYQPMEPDPTDYLLLYKTVTYLIVEISTSGVVKYEYTRKFLENFYNRQPGGNNYKCLMHQKCPHAFSKKCHVEEHLFSHFFYLKCTCGETKNSFRNIRRHINDVHV